jgi:tannase
MRSTIFTLFAVASTAVNAASLTDVCTQAYAQASLPRDEFYGGITIDPLSVTTTVVTNTSVSGQVFYPDAVFDYCNVTFAYSHDGRDDQVLVTYWLPTPDKFKNRYLSTGGGGLAINSGSRSLPGGIIYGAVAGLTDGGFGGFDTQFDAVFLLANNTVNWQSVYMFGYQAHHELSVLGKEFTKQFFNMSETKLYSYYQACSEGGREGWSQVQRFADEWDGAAIGAPAFRYGFQQTQHLYSNVVEQTLNYYPPQCELDKIVTETIAACDLLDGRNDGVVSRSDLCKLHFDLDSIIGKPYSCAATGSSISSRNEKRQLAPVTSSPAQSGNVTALAVAVAKEIINGLHDLQGRRVYLSYQPAASFVDAATTYNSTSDSWELSISGLGGEWITRFLELQNTSTLASLEGVTYDTLKAWMIQGSQMYGDSLQTTWPDLTPFHDAKGKVLHFHGEADNSIPTASSVRYWESVRQTMYPELSYNESTAAMNDWYRLFLIPGAAHCSTNPLQPNGPFPQTTLAVLINWVEMGIEPTTLDATVLQGDNIGENQQICGWPLRPLWTNNGTVMECRYDKPSIESWLYDFDGIKVPVY